MTGVDLTNDDVQFVQDLVSAVPELRPALSNHLADNDELLPHAFMADVTRFTVIMCHAMSKEGESRATAEVFIRRIMRFLEVALASGSEPTKELIAVSFIENLWGEDIAISAVAPFFGPALRAEMRSHELLRI